MASRRSSDLSSFMFVGNASPKGLVGAIEQFYPITFNYTWDSWRGLDTVKESKAGFVLGNETICWEATQRARALPFHALVPHCTSMWT